MGLTKSQRGAVVKEFQASSGGKWSKVQLQSQLSYLMSLFALLKELDNLLGWSIDESHRILELFQHSFSTISHAVKSAKLHF